MLIEIAWWRHQMETFSALRVLCAGNSAVPGEFPTQRPVTRRFDVFFDLRLNKRLSKQSWGWWFETISRPLWRHCNGLNTIAFRSWISNWIIITGRATINHPYPDFTDEAIAWINAGVPTKYIFLWNFKILENPFGSVVCEISIFQISMCHVITDN